MGFESKIEILREVSQVKLRVGNFRKRVGARLCKLPLTSGNPVRVRVLYDWMLTQGRPNVEDCMGKVGCERHGP